MKMLVTVNISKGFARWKEMAESLNPEMEKVDICRLAFKMACSPIIYTYLWWFQIKIRR